MSTKSISFDDKKIKKVNFTKTKRYFRQTTLILIKYQFLKKNHVAPRMHLNTLLDTMIMMLLDHYVQDFRKRVAIPESLMKMQQCLKLIKNGF